MIDLIIADDFEVMQRVMKLLLEREPDIRVIAQVGSFDALTQVCQGDNCDVIILDDYLPSYECDMAVKQLREAQVIAAILITSMHADVDMVRRALNAGASGFLLKTDFEEHLVPAVRALHAGETYLSPQIAQLLRGLKPT